MIVMYAKKIFKAISEADSKMKYKNNEKIVTGYKLYVYNVFSVIQLSQKR